MIDKSVWWKLLNSLHGSHRKYNLMAPEYNKSLIFRRHIKEAYYYREIISDYGMCKKHEILDIGTGAGFPGIPLAVLFPENRFYLNDRKRIRTDFVKTLAKDLALSNVSTITEDITNLSPEDRTFDIITARAVSRIAVIEEACLHILKPAGMIILGKGMDIKHELEQVRYLTVSEIRPVPFGNMVILHKR